MKKLIPVLALLIVTMGAQAASSNLDITGLATGANTKAAFNTMAKGHDLPAWVRKGGVTTPPSDVKLDGSRYQVMMACKPHDCSSQRMAVIYSAKSGKMAGVLSDVNDKKNTEQLTWLGDDNTLTIDAKTVLLAALTGALDNHPGAFNY